MHYLRRLFARWAGRAPELTPRHELYDLVDLLTEAEKEALLPVVMLLLGSRVTS